MIQQPMRSTLFPYTTLFRSFQIHERQSDSRYDRHWRRPGWSGNEQTIVQKVMDGHERSEEHTSELQSRRDLVCRLLLEKKDRSINKTAMQNTTITCINRQSI